MRSIRLLMMSALAVPLLGGAVAAQVQMYPGQDVAVNPAGIKGGQVLLYPGGTMARVVPALREPGGKDGVIHLHMPRKHRAVQHTAAAPSQSESLASAPDEESAPPPPKKRRVAMTPPPASPAPQPQATAPTPETPDQSAGAAPIPFSFDSSSPPPMAAAPAPRKPAPTPMREKPATKLATATPPPATTKVEQTPASLSGGKLTRRGRILFAKEATEPVPAAANGLSMLAGDLNDALLKGAERIELLAYGGARSDKSSDARRLSLKRALTIRQLLIDRGVPSDRIDVRAMGGADSGEPDRVDVFIKQG